VDLLSLLVDLEPPSDDFYDDKYCDCYNGEEYQEGSDDTGGAHLAEGLCCHDS
jgi:hypothetical protein